MLTEELSSFLSIWLAVSASWLPSEQGWDYAKFETGYPGVQLDEAVWLNNSVHLWSHVLHSKNLHRIL
jgi:hypothetical protein